MNKFKLSLLVIALASGSYGHAQVAEQAVGNAASKSHLSSEAPVVVESHEQVKINNGQERALPGSLERLPKKQRDLAIGYSETNKSVDKLRMEKELEDAKTALAKAKLEHQRTLKDIKELENPSESRGFDSNEPWVNGSNAGGARGLPAKAAPLTPAPVVEPASPFEKVFVTRVFGIGSDRTATVYINNSIFNLKQGDVATGGIKLVKFTDQGAIFSHKGKTSSIPLSSQDQAYSRTFRDSGQFQVDGSSAPISSPGF